MANSDWWAQSTAPQTPEQQAHAQQAAAVERQWAVEARAVEEERSRRKASAFSQLAIGGVALLLGVGAWLIDLGPYQAIFYAIGFLFGYSGFRQLLRTI